MDTNFNFTNNPNLPFSSLEDEQFRVYEFPNGSKITIENPMALNVSKTEIGRASWRGTV